MAELGLKQFQGDEVLRSIFTAMDRIVAAQARALED